MDPIDSDFARAVATSITGEWRLRAQGAYANGYAAAQAGQTMGACPFHHTHPDWPLWRDGFIDGVTLPEGPVKPLPEDMLALMKLGNPFEDTSKN